VTKLLLPGGYCMWHSNCAIGVRPPGAFSGSAGGAPALRPTTHLPQTSSLRLAATHQGLQPSQALCRCCPCIAGAGHMLHSEGPYEGLAEVAARGPRKPSYLECGPGWLQQDELYW
jgi:hypothetical protein